ncbi:MAG: pyruvate kinase [Bacteroidales bacterium]|nr:pyruvate kinase [Bacteroidales bacterium]
MRKKTKIVATISDNKCDVSFIKELFDNGVNVIRINTAHATFEGAKKVIENVRQVSEKIAILVDTKGPEIRTMPMEKSLEVNYGEMVRIAGVLAGTDTSTLDSDLVYVNYDKFVSDVPIESKILIDDGALELVVKKKCEKFLDCMAMNRGVIQGKKSVNIPSAHIKLPALSKKDIQFINFAVEQDLDFIAHSFVRKKEDVIAVQTILDALSSDIKIIAKIENKEGVDNIEEILDYAYGVMVARGDLAIEISPEKLPVVQKQIVEKAIQKRRPVIVATQMLHSMIENPRPTRAEVNDVANAIYDGTDAIMLSGETAYGKYPVESVLMMKNIAKEVESNVDTYKSLEAKALMRKSKDPLTVNDKVSAQLQKLAIEAAEDLNVKAIIADTTSGRTIRGLAAFRGRNTIYAQCYDKRTMRKLALSYGVHVDYIENTQTHAAFIKNALNNLMHKKTFSKESLVVIVAGNFGRSTGASYMEIATVDNLLKS